MRRFVYKLGYVVLGWLAEQLEQLKPDEPPPSAAALYDVPHRWDIDTYPQRCVYCGQLRNAVGSCPQRRIS